MATAALTNPELRIVALADADLMRLEELFDQQCDEWLGLLRWDYKGASRLIREVTRQRDLPGVAAMMGSHIIGFAFYVIEGNRCSIGDIYVSKQWRGLGADRQMVAAILDKLDRLPHLRRIESQCVGIGNDAANALFQARGFERFDRFYMLADLASLPLIEVEPRKIDSPSGVALRGWEEEDFQQAARIILRSYRGEHDSLINSQYRTEEGCAELLSVLTEHIWCGDFLDSVSRVAVDFQTGKLVGVLICSRIASGAGHIGQISILPEYQGMGLGRHMIRESLLKFARLGFDVVSLAVTSANTSAVHLYRSCGFRVIHEFPVFYNEAAHR